MTFTKADLKTGMVVEFNNGQKALCIVGEFKTFLYGEQTLLFIQINGFMNGIDYDENLIIVNDKFNVWTIKKVYKPRISTFSRLLDDCNEKTLIWERKPEVDWSKVPVDTKILVRIHERDEWDKRYFAKYENEKVYAFNNGATSWSNNRPTTVSSWNYAKLAEGE